MRAPHLLQKYQLSFTQLLLLAGCLILPAIAATKIGHIFDYRIVLLYAALISIFSYFACASDKKKAQREKWRIPESTLHFLELAGGWPGSFVAQRRFRHKIAKINYQITFWLIIILYQGVSLDYLNEWKYSAKAVSYIFPK